jgi:hypothetical protein
LPSARFELCAAVWDGLCLREARPNRDRTPDKTAGPNLGQNRWRVQHQTEDVMRNTITPPHPRGQSERPWHADDVTALVHKLTGRPHDHASHISASA